MNFLLGILLNFSVAYVLYRAPMYLYAKIHRNWCDGLAVKDERQTELHSHL